MKNFPCTEMLPIGGKYDKNNMKAVFQKNAIWPQGARGSITLTFGSEKMIDNKICNGCSPNAAWSLIGSNSSADIPSMNLGFIDPPTSEFTFKDKSYPLDLFQTEHRNFEDNPKWEPGATVVHEFCHALGMLHEHQNNLFGSNKIQLNEDAVIDYYANQNGGNRILAKEIATINVIEWYNKRSDYEGSRYDPLSIMLYPLPDTFIKPGYKNPTDGNFTLSKLDKRWLYKEYPLDSRNYPVLTVEFIDNYPVEWKEAWIIKVIQDKLSPFVGIKWIFETNFFGQVVVEPTYNPTYNPLKEKYLPILKFNRTENFNGFKIQIHIISIICALLLLLIIQKF